jgi:hypothetical protein
MAHNDKQDKTQQGGGPAAHPSNVPPKGHQGGGEDGPGGNKVSQGRGSDTGNKGKD